MMVARSLSTQSCCVTAWIVALDLSRPVSGWKSVPQSHLISSQLLSNPCNFFRRAVNEDGPIEGQMMTRFLTRVNNGSNAPASM